MQFILFLTVQAWSQWSELLITAATAEPPVNNSFYSLSSNLLCNFSPLINMWILSAFEGREGLREGVPALILWLDPSFWCWILFWRKGIWWHGKILQSIARDGDGPWRRECKGRTCWLTWFSKKGILKGDLKTTWREESCRGPNWTGAWTDLGDGDGTWNWPLKRTLSKSTRQRLTLDGSLQI